MTVILEIEALGHRGVGIGRCNGKVIVVPFTAPGDRVEVNITRSHRTYEEGVPVRIIGPSPLRIDPPCPVFGYCGGCHFQHLPIDRQRRIKADLFREMLSHSGDVPAEFIGDILHAPQALGYRSRLEAHIVWNGEPHAGFMARKSEEVVPVRTCFLALPPLQETIAALPDLLYHARASSVTMADITADASKLAVDITLLSSPPISRDTRDRLGRYAAKMPQVKSILSGQRRSGPAAVLWSRKPDSKGVSYALPLQQEEAEISLTVWPGIFRQVNPFGNRLLVSTVLEWIREQQCSERVLDLYAGMGNLSIPVSYLVPEIVAVEVDPRAVENGSFNASVLRRHNIHWVQTSCAQALRTLLKHQERFQTVILDPPRSGAREILADLAALGPEHIIYVSCDPATLARDVRFLQHEGNYIVRRSLPLDMFPQTFHIESITLLHRM